MKYSKGLILLICFSCPWNLLLAQTTDCAEFTAGIAQTLCSKAANLLSVDQPVPQSPGFSIIGVTPEEAIQPGTSNDLAVSLLNGLDKDGHFQNGLALDFSPYMVLAGSELTLQDYQDNWVARLLVNTQVSIATSKGQNEEDKSGRAGLGIRISPWIINDPRRDQETLDCVSTQIVAIENLPPISPNASEEAKQEREDILANPVPAGTCEFTKDSGGLTFGAARGFVSEDSSFSTLKGSNSSFWVSLGVPLGTNVAPGLDNLGQLILHVRQDNDELVKMESMPDLVLQDSTTAATRFRFNGPDQIMGMSRVRLELEASYARVKPAGLPEDEFYQYLGELYFKVPALSDVVWIKLIFGKTNGVLQGDNNFGGLSFQWGFNDRKVK